MIKNDTKTKVFEILVNANRDKTIACIKKQYSCFPYEECEDIFQEASTALWLKFIAQEGWNGEELDKLLMGYCRNIAKKHFSKFHDDVEWEPTHSAEEEQREMDFGYVNIDVYRKLQKEQMYKLIEQLSPTDQKLMQMYLLHKRAKDICKELGYTSSQVVKNRKCVIVARLRKEIGGQVIDTCPLFLSPASRIISILSYKKTEFCCINPRIILIFAAEEIISHHHKTKFHTYLIDYT